MENKKNKKPRKKLGCLEILLLIIIAPITIGVGLWVLFWIGSDIFSYINEPYKNKERTGYQFRSENIFEHEDSSIDFIPDGLYYKSNFSIDTLNTKNYNYFKTSPISFFETYNWTPTPIDFDNMVCYEDAYRDNKFEKFIIVEHILKEEGAFYKCEYTNVKILMEKN